MPRRNKKGSLTDYEKKIVKRLLYDGWRNQDIQALINIGRESTINSARISGVKGNDKIEMASCEEVDKYIKIQKAWDLRRRLNPYIHERIYRSIEAMRMAVSAYNNPTMKFKSEIFSVLSVIAWTYILQEYYLKNDIAIEKNGKYFSLRKLLNKPECPLDNAEKRNLFDLIEIRDKVEHRMMADSDILWTSLFQATCMNYNNFLKINFWESLAIDDIGYSLQFSKLSKDQLGSVQGHDIPQEINVLNAKMIERAKELGIEEDYGYRMRLILTYTSSGPSDSYIKFISPESAEGKEIAEILVKERPADDLYPYKPKDVCEKVKQITGRRFTLYDHTQMWKKYKVRPPSGSQNPNHTNKNFCIYHQAHKDYTYNDAWVDFIAKEINKGQ